MTSMDWTPKLGTCLMALEYTTLDRICVVGKIWGQVKPGFILRYLILFYEGALDMEWYVTNEARRAELFMIISYPASPSRIIV